MVGKLRLRRDVRNAEAVRELMERFTVPYVSSQGYEVAPPKPKPTQDNHTVLGGGMCIHQIVKELLERIIVT